MKTKPNPLSMLIAGVLVAVVATQDATARVQAPGARRPADSSATLQLPPHWHLPGELAAPVPVVQIEELGQAQQRPRAQQTVSSTRFIGEPVHGEMLAKGLLGTPVVSDKGVRVASISDLLFNSDNQVVGLVLSWGDAEGFGGKRVAVSPYEVELGVYAGEVVAAVSLSWNELAAAPAFVPLGGGGRDAHNQGWKGLDGAGARRFSALTAAGRT